MLALLPLVSGGCWDVSLAGPRLADGGAGERPGQSVTGDSGGHRAPGPGGGATSWGEEAAPDAPVFRLVFEPRASAGRDRLWLVSPRGQRLLNLLPRLLVSYHRLRPGRQPALRPRVLVFGAPKLSRDASGWSVQARAQNRWATHTLTLLGAANDPRVRLRWEARYHRDQLVGLELARFILDDVRSGTMLDRAHVHQPLSWRQFTGVLSPRQLQVTLDRPAGRPTSLTLVGGAGVQGLYVRHRARRSYSVDLELDHHLNHPFRRYTKCVKKKTRRVERRRLYFGLRRAGSRRVLGATWLLGRARLVTATRFPRGFQAAMVLCDHADQSSAAKLEALAFGRSGAVARGETGARFPGLVNRGLAYSKTIFIQRSGPYARQMEHPDYRRLLDRMAGQGVEIGVHSPTGRRDPPLAGRLLLDRFRGAFAGRTWVDHQPNTNCEAIGNQGWDRRSPWYMLGHLSELDFRYLWSGEDLPLAWGSLNLLAPGARARRRPVLYVHSRLERGRPAPFVLFSTAWSFVPRKRLLRHLSPPWIQRLVNERGLYLGHVYLDTHLDKPLFQRRSLLESRGVGKYALHGDVDRVFSRLASRQARKDLWVTGLEAVADHLLAAMDVELSHLPGGHVRVAAVAGPALRGLTLLLPLGAASARVDGQAPSGTRARRGRVEVWFDLHPGKPRLLQVLDATGKPLELLRPARLQLGAR